MTGSGNHTYLLRGDSGALLVDAGVGDPRHLASLATHLNDWGTVLSQVLVTHGHHDHVAGATALAAAHAHAQFFKWPWAAEDARYQVPWRPLAEPSRFALDDGTDLEAIYTPGHSPDHVAFWHATSRTLLCGDLVLPGGSVVIQWSRGGDMAQYLESLSIAIGLAPDRLLAAHGPEVADARGLLEETLSHRLLREAQIVERLAGGLETVEAIVDSIYHGLAPPYVAAARENVRAHLEKLGNEGRAVRRGEQWRRT